MIHTDSTRQTLADSASGGRCSCAFPPGSAVLSRPSCFRSVLPRPPWHSGRRGGRGREHEGRLRRVIVDLKASNSFKIGTWTPVWVQLRGGSERFSGFMEVIVADDDGTPTSFRMPVEVGANQSERFTAYVRPGSREPEFTIRLLDQNGRRVGGASQDDGDAASLPSRSCRTRR